MLLICLHKFCILQSFRSHVEQLCQLDKVNKIIRHARLLTKTRGYSSCRHSRSHDLFNLLAMNPKSAHRAITPIAKKSTSASPSPTPNCCTACTGCTRKAMIAKTRNNIPIFFTPVLFSWLPFSCGQHHVSSRAHNHGGGKGGEEGQWICTWPTVVKVSINACKKGSTSCSWLSNA